MPCQIKDKTIWNDEIQVRSITTLLDSVNRISFINYFEQKGLLDPKQKHYLVAIIENLLALARNNKWDLTKEDDFTYFFNGCFWESVSKDKLKIFLMNVAIRQGYNELECKGYEFQDKLLKQFLGTAHLDKKINNSNKVIINTLNTTIEIENGNIITRAFNKNDFLKYQLPFYYVPEAKAPKFMKFLNEVLPNTNLQNILQEYCGYIFTRHLKLEKCLILLGSGANGKSVFLDILNSLLGSNNITNYSLASLNQEHNRANIKDSLVNWCYEINGQIEHDTFKNLVSGEPIQARLKYGNSFMMKDYAKLAANANSLPSVEHNEAYFRRLLIVKFDITIPTELRNPLLAKEIIMEELSGVFNWVLEGLKRLVQQNGFTPTPEVDAMIAEYKKESDTVATFIDESGYKLSQTGKVRTNQLFNEYTVYCRDGGFRNLNINNFSNRLKLLGYTHINAGGFRGFWVEK